MLKTLEDMTTEEFLAAINGYINREDEEIPSDQFFQMAVGDKRPTLEIIEVPVRTVNGEIHIEPVENLVVVENNTLILDGKRLVFKLVS